MGTSSMPFKCCPKDADAVASTDAEVSFCSSSAIQAEWIGAGLFHDHLKPFWFCF